MKQFKQHNCIKRVHSNNTSRTRGDDSTRTLQYMCINIRIYYDEPVPAEIWKLRTIVFKNKQKNVVLCVVRFGDQSSVSFVFFFVFYKIWFKSHRTKIRLYFSLVCCQNIVSTSKRVFIYFFFRYLPTALFARRPYLFSRLNWFLVKLRKTIVPRTPLSPWSSRGLVIINYSSWFNHRFRSNVLRSCTRTGNSIKTENG